MKLLRSEVVATTLGMALLMFSMLAEASTIRFAPATHDFGNVTIGSSSTVNVFLDASAGADTLRSLGLDANLPVSGLTSGDFTLALGTCNPVPGAATGTPLNNGSGCTFTVTYTPTVAGAATATATVSDYMAGAWGNMNLTANGVAPAPSSVSVPTLSEWGMIILSSLLVLGALVARRCQDIR